MTSRRKRHLAEPEPTSFHGVQTDCCVVGAGPAGIMLGLLLARAGVRVVVLEKHHDFHRDFHGDTVHASTLEVMWEMGLLERLLERPHQELKELTGEFFGERVRLADFSELPTHAQFVALMPQRDFLAFVAEQAEKLPTFQLFMGSEVTELVVGNGEVLGVRAETAQGSREIRARLTVGADGRTSSVRRLAGLRSRDYGESVDVLWFRLSKRPEDGRQPLGNVGRGRVLLLLDHGEYWQCAFVVEKDSLSLVDRGSLRGVRAELRDVSPLPVERLEELDDWSKVDLRSIQMSHLERWARPGLICIGDAAHALSPLGGVGINLAIQDAVATARVVTPLLRAERTPSLHHLRRIQRRRAAVSYLTMCLQLAVQNRFLGAALHGETAQVPHFVKWLSRSSRLQRLVGRLVGLGLRTEQVPASAAS
jgi:2-polyprenyl-6-methoxyphenol hydroxylase-like FAD-dependent oxidoreductase